MSSKNLRVPLVARANFHNQVTENGFTKKEYSHVGHFFFFLTGGFKQITYSRWKSCLVMSNQQPVSSLGSEAVMSGVSVDKRTLEPQCASVKLNSSEIPRALSQNRNHCKFVILCRNKKYKNPCNNSTSVIS